MRITFTISLFIYCVLILSFNSCKKDKLLDDNNDLLKKSFPRIYNLEGKAFSKTEARIDFSIADVVPNDPIVKKEIRLSPNTDSQEVYEITILEENFKVLDSLKPATQYYYDVRVETNDESNFVFISEEKSFFTPRLDLVMNRVEEFDKQLKLTATSEFIDLQEQDIEKINAIGHEWSNSNRSILSSAALDKNRLRANGSFESDLDYFDFSEGYSVMAYAVIEGESDTIWSDTLYHSIESAGDFWVNLNEIGNPFSEIPHLMGLEGAVSFELGGYAYVGLGRNNSKEYPTNFYKYDPQVNRWISAKSYPGGGRMYASSFVIGDKAYVGLGCSDCDNYDGYYNLENSDKIDSVELVDFHNNFYVFDMETEEWSNESIMLSDVEGRFAAYAFTNNNIAYVGGGLIKNTIKGDIPIIGNVSNQIDPGEWHDLNGNNQMDYYELPVTELMLSQSEACAILSGFKTIFFCMNCGFYKDNMDIDQNENVLISIVEVDSPLHNSKNYKINLKGETSSNIYFNNDDNFHIETQIILNSNNDNLIWRDSNDNGRIDFESSLMELGSGTLPTIDVFKIGNKWTDKSMNYDINLDMGNLCCDCGEDRINLDEIYCNVESLPIDTIWTEWIDNGSQIGEPEKDEYTYGFHLDSTLWRFAVSEFNSLSETTRNARYGSTSFSFQNQAATLVSGANRAPLLSNILLDSGATFDENTLEEFPIVNFKPRIHASSFVFGNKGYIVGGEAEKELTLTLDLWEYDSANGKFIQLTGCGITSMTRGIGFSLLGRGYIGFGKVNNQTELNNEFWAYIPGTGN